METEFKGKYSQEGEDAIACHVLNLLVECGRLTLEDSISVEFGAHDGSNSNFLRLAETGIRTVFIEGSQERFNNLRRKVEKTSSIIPINAMVGFDGHQEYKTLESILSANDIELNKVRFLSIDIDGDDIHILSSLSIDVDFLIIEYNPTFSFDSYFENPKGSEIGSSPLALVKIAGDRGFSLVAVSKTNLCFIANRHSDLIDQIKLNEYSTRYAPLRLAMGYDGSIIATEGYLDRTGEIIGLGWGTSFFIQPIPKFLRKFNQYNRIRTIYCAVVLLLIRPSLLKHLIIKVLKAKS
jgi:hypothetical protein